MRMPKPPRGTRGVHGTSHRGDAARVSMSRKHGQELRPRQGLSFATKVNRVLYWQQRMLQLAQDTTQQVRFNLNVLGHQELRDATQFQGANLSTATLDSAAPSTPSQPTVAGIGEGGIAPPPPPK